MYNVIERLEKLVEHAKTQALKRDDLKQEGVPWCWQRREALASTSKNQKECYVSVMGLRIIEVANL